MTLYCQACNKRLSKKSARLINNKLLCSPCAFPQYCKVCNRRKNAGGYSGPQCVCDIDLTKADKGPSVGTMR